MKNHARVLLRFGHVLVIAGLLPTSTSAFANDTYTHVQYPTLHAKGYVRGAQTLDLILGTPHDTFTAADGAVPGSYSIRGQAGPVENQGQCGSCWDFSLTTVLRGTQIMNGKDPGRLSFNYLLNCATDQQGCNGGDFNAAAWFVSPKGAPAYGSDGEYTAIGGNCVSASSVTSAKAYHMLGANGTTPSFRDIAFVVGVLHQPVSIDIAADSNWEGYGSGVYNGCSDQNSADINHMVSVEGYSCETAVDSSGNCAFDANGNLPNGVGTWIIRNSWGTEWGDGGYITMKATNAAGQRCNMVANDALYFDPQ